MYIVIVGDGKVGSLLTEYFAGEGHDVVVIDTNQELIQNLINSYDVMGICGNGANYRVQMEAGVKKADVLIAAASSDELNILCCMVGRKIGAKRTIARVRNPDYSKQLGFMRDELGLSMVVNPEYEAAASIARVLRYPSAIKLDTFAKGRVDLAEILIERGSPLVGNPLYSLPKLLKVNILICAVQRGDSIYIPTGDFVLREGDRIHITANHEDLVTFFKVLKIYKKGVRDVMIVGGGKVGFYLAELLSDSGMHIKLIEKDHDRCMELAEDLPDVSVVYGDGTNENVLLEEGIEKVDAFVALTGIDEENIITAMYAKNKDVRKVISKVNRMAFTNMIESLNVGSIVSPKQIAADLILSYVRAMQNSMGSNVRTLYKLVDGKVEALEFYVSDTAPFTDIPLRDLKLKKNVLLACIIRGNQIIYPHGDDVLRFNDRVIVVTTNKYLRDLINILE